MGIVKKIFGVPEEHQEEKKKHEVVKAPEFDITQYAKKLGVSIGILIGAVIAGLKAVKVEEVTDPVLVGMLAVVAAAMLGMSFVMAVDLAARAYLTGEGAAEETAPDDDPADGDLIPATPGTIAWLQGEDEPRPVLAMTGDGEKVSSYLVAAGASVSRTVGGKTVGAIDGTPKWFRAEEIRAIRPAKWP
ncbi:MAG TPA: hypothetical protein VK480_11185 [Solirubrobacterales bacterium]|nr:hypothetical protein [Solirubrobacterales bacterium]